MSFSFAQTGEEVAELLPASSAKSLPIFTVSSASPYRHTGGLESGHADWLQATGWKGRAGSHTFLPGEHGVAGVLLALAENGGAPLAAMQMGNLSANLPDGAYHLASDALDAETAALAWLNGAYSFRRYLRNETRRMCRLVAPAGINRADIIAQAQAVWFARDLINAPSNDLGPDELSAALIEIGEAFGAETDCIRGGGLLTENFPMIHAVGRASDRPPSLTGLRWGSPDAPKVTIVGKGVCFDTGGLNIKPAQSMALMKKDMGGAATAICLAAMIMAAQLPVRLRVLIPAADNSIAGNAFRPGDILRSRNGMSVEIANTDAEGRLLLADALTLADEEAPDLLIDLATLTGAARVALGPDLPAMFTDDDGLAENLYRVGLELGDPVWRMPFWMPYDSYLKSKVADVNHIFNGPFAGSITAALFLKRFVKNARHFVHLDIFAWTPRSVPGKPAGGEPQTARALFEVIKRIYAKA